MATPRHPRSPRRRRPVAPFLGVLAFQGAFVTQNACIPGTVPGKVAARPMAGKNGSKFENTMYVTAYQYARDGMSDEQIGNALGATGVTFRRWCANDDALADAVARGREIIDGQDAMNFPDYVYQHLSPELRSLWDEIHECAQLENGVERVEAALRNGGKYARQHLFVHALATTCFNVSKSMRLLNVSRKMYDDWRKNDPGFADLLDEMNWHKQNFFEQAFIGRVAAGDTPAILHAVKSQLGHRGYGDKMQMEHTGTIEHKHTVDVTDLNLPLEARVAILDAVEVHEAEQAKLPAPQPLPA